MVDIAIIGSGPAGYSAAITARQRNKSCIIFSSKTNSTWLSKVDCIANYPGLPSIAGLDLLKRMEQQATEMGTEFVDGFVQQISNFNDTFYLSIGSDVFEAKTVIIATGAKQSKLLNNEEKLIGNGVSYCATCDGMFYKGKKIAVLGYSNVAFEEANYLNELSDDITFIACTSEIQKAASQHLKKEIKVVNAVPKTILGEEKFTGIETTEGVTQADGVFIFRDSVLYDKLFPDLQIENGFINVDRRMQTNIPGIFAAGDCAGKPHQIAKAAGEGNIAALTACDFIDKK